MMVLVLFGAMNFGHLCAQRNGGALPNAEVKNLGAINVNVDSYYKYDLIGGSSLTTATNPFDLQIAMEFIAKDSAEEAASNAYANYTTDFFITLAGFNGQTLTADGCYLAGYYPSFNEWVVIPLDGLEIEKGVAYPVITAAGIDFKYTDICTSVGDFICGIYIPESSCLPKLVAAQPFLFKKRDISQKKGTRVRSIRHGCFHMFLEGTVFCSHYLRKVCFRKLRNPPFLRLIMSINASTCSSERTPDIRATPRQGRFMTNITLLPSSFFSTAISTLRTKEIRL